MGRNKIIWTDNDYYKVEQMCVIQCTGEEVASVMGVDYDTLNRLLRDKYGMQFQEYYKTVAPNGRAALRRMQYKAAEKGNVTMLIWLGKQYLGQTEKVENNNMERVTIVNDINPTSNSQQY